MLLSAIASTISRGVGRVLPAFAAVLFPGVSQMASAQGIVVQDGYSFSGSVIGAPIGPKVKLTATTNWVAGANLGSFAFRSGVFDGSKIWLLAVDADHLIEIDPETGEQIAVPLPDVSTGFQKFSGGVFDGTQIFLVPFDADRVVAITAANGASTEYPAWPDGFTKGAGAFAGGVFDGTHVWLIPHNADRVVRVDPTDGSMTGFDAWPAGFVPGGQAFWGGVFDGRYVWMIPYSADRVVRLDTSDGSMTGFDAWPAGFAKGAQAFAGAAFDGRYVWMAPYSADRIVVLDTTDGAMRSVAWPDGFTPVDEAFAGALFDGADVWLVPFDESRLVRVDPATDTVSIIEDWPSEVTPSAGNKFAGAVFDGTRIYLAPAEQSVLVTIAPDDPARLVNLSSRANVGTGDQVLIPGFVIAGTGTKKVLVRGIGPGLTAFGVEGALETPVLTLHDVSGEIATNSGWETSPDAAEIVSTGAAVGAFELASGSADCALLATLAPGAYTAHLAGQGNTSGVGLVEIYDAEPDADNASLMNVSARALVGVGDEVLIPGFAMTGREQGRLLIRAIGPGLAEFGVEGVLEDPILTVFSGGSEIVTNDDWEQATNAAEIATVAETIGAFALASGSRDAAVLIDLPPSGYTVRVAGVGDTSGVASVEIFFVP